MNNVSKVKTFQSIKRIGGNISTLYESDKLLTYKSDQFIVKFNHPLTQHESSCINPQNIESGSVFAEFEELNKNDLVKHGVVNTSLNSALKLLKMYSTPMKTSLYANTVFLNDEYTYFTNGLFAIRDKCNSPKNMGINLDILKFYRLFKDELVSLYESENYYYFVSNSYTLALSKRNAESIKCPSINPIYDTTSFNNHDILFISFDAKKVCDIYSSLHKPINNKLLVLHIDIKKEKITLESVSDSVDIFIGKPSFKVVKSVPIYVNFVAMLSTNSNNFEKDFYISDTVYRNTNSFYVLTDKDEGRIFSHVKL